MYRPILASGALLAAITLTQACRAAPSHFTPDMAFCPEHTRDGYLPPWEVAKAAALDSVISDMERHLGKSCWELLGRGKVPYIAGRLALQGGGQPQERAVRKILAKCRKKDWYPDKQPENVGGRPPVFSDHAKQEVARVAMEHKRSLVRPTPALCRARLPRKTINKRTGNPISDRTVQRVFEALCFDETENDPWQWLGSACQEYLPAHMKPIRAAFGELFLQRFAAGAWFSFVAIDPCRSLLPKTPTKAEEQKHAAMGKMGWRSKRSLRMACNCQKVSTANSQTSGSFSVSWTPVFARGNVKIYLCGLDDAGPEKLTDGQSVGKFVQDVLPGVLRSMQAEFGWATLPRVVVHDKASYFVSPQHGRLQRDFALGLAGGGLRSWLGDCVVDTNWVAARLGDFYPHETLISHIRRLLAHKFPAPRVGEALHQFRHRLDLIEEHLNSGAWSTSHDALRNLSKSYSDRAREVGARNGERIPK